MTGPDRIWHCDHLGEYGYCYPTAEEAEGEHGGIAHEYIRRDPAVLAELPEVQALIRQAVEAGIIRGMHIALTTPIEQVPDAIAAAIRKRGEG